MNSEGDTGLFSEAQLQSEVGKMEYLEEQGVGQVSKNTPVNRMEMEKWCGLRIRTWRLRL